MPYTIIAPIIAALSLSITAMALLFSTSAPQPPRIVTPPAIISIPEDDSTPQDTGIGQIPHLDPKQWEI